MPGRADSERAGPLKYAAQLPWIGPIVGQAGSEAEALVRIGGASDPVLGNALLAVFLPVIRDAERRCFVASNANGEGSNVVDVGWAASLENDRNGHFRLDAQFGIWAGEIAGVLMLLLYDQSGVFLDPSTGKSGNRLFPVSWDAQIEELDSTSVPPDPARTTPIRDLPEPMQAEIKCRVCDLLTRPSKALEPGLIELNGRVVPGPGKPADFTFAVASCQYPAGFVDRDVAEQSYESLKNLLKRRDPEFAPACLLLLGDQIYADATAGLFDPSTLYDRFEIPYERLLRTPPLRRIMRSIPVYTMLDDHEIEDDWEPVAKDNRPDDNMINGRRFYFEYQRMAGPQQTDPLCDSTQPLWYAFVLHGVPFFVADTRSERRPRTAETIEDARIMSDGQFGALLDWLAGHRKSDVPKFIASPACLLPRKLRATQHGHPASALRSDAWDGYPYSFHRLLAYIADNEIKNVVFLSGDEHISFATHAIVRAHDSGATVPIRSIHSSALYAPFPFANAIPDALAGKETFDFTLPAAGTGVRATDVAWGGAYRCEVATEFAPLGDGFSLLQVLRKENGAWAVRCRFDRDPPQVIAGKWFDVL
jgi:cholesterol oxidase